MKTLWHHIYRLRIWRDDRGQDLIEFALLAGLVGVASGLFLPGLSESMNNIYSKITSKLVEAGG